VLGARCTGLASTDGIGADWVGWFIACLLKRKASFVSVYVQLYRYLGIA
jgi:hypothetical protein